MKYHTVIPITWILSPGGFEHDLKSEALGHPGPEVIKLFSCSTQLSMKFLLLINLKLLTIANSFLLNIAEHEIFSANKYENANYCWHFHIYLQRKFLLLAFSYLFGEKISCSAELSMKKSFITSGQIFLFPWKK